MKRFRRNDDERLERIRTTTDAAPLLHKCRLVPGAGCAFIAARTRRFRGAASRGAWIEQPGAPLCPESQARHLPVSVGRSVAPGVAGLQTTLARAARDR